MKNKYLLLTCLLLLVLSACFEEDINNNISEENKKTTDLNKELILENGRLKFSSRKILNSKIEEFKTQDLNNTFLQLNTLYNKDFLSFRPLIDSEDEEKVSNYLYRRGRRPILQNVFHQIEKLKSIDQEDFNEKLEELIADDEFASLLNENGEIQVGDSLFKYTESGLYMVHINDEDYLKEYLNKNRELLSQNKHSYTKLYRDSRYEQIDERIMRFRAIEDNPIENNNSYRPIRTFSNLPNEIAKEAQNWQPTEGRETVFGGIFGDRRVAYAYASDHRRAKVIYTNQDFELWGKVGVEVKYQKKASGIWWRYEADQIVLGINEMSYYTEINTEYVENIPKTTWYWENKIFNEHLSDITYSVDKYPEIKLLNKIKLVLNLEKLNRLETGFITIPDEYIFPVEKLNELAWEYINKEFKNILRNLGRNTNEANNLSMIAISKNRTYYLEFDYSEIKYNSRYVRKTYERKFEIPKIVYTPGNAQHPIRVDFNNKLIENNTVKVDFYGGIKRGDNWYGRRIVYK